MLKSPTPSLLASWHVKVTAIDAYPLQHVAVHWSPNAVDAPQSVSPPPGMMGAAHTMAVIENN